MKQELTLENLKELDFGKVDVAFARHLKRAVEDCMDRPGDETARVVRLSFLLKPVKDQDGHADDVAMQCQVTSKVPAHKSKVFSCRPRKGGHLFFDSETPENFDQGSFTDLKEETQNDE